ncbi:MAG TPA: hypothetical protein PLD54_04315, partial [Candidatus Levybacteria bacterium]|nr:hypothetical protein [Candidatus Levybacteria bacterium]
MKILSALRKKKAPRDFYLSLIFKPHKVAAILFEKTQESLVIISTKEEMLSTDLDLLGSEELVKVADIVISSVEGALPEGEMVENTIFSVPYSWQTDGKITRDNLTKLKEICDALELKAIGFIISVEAIVNFLHKKDGAPITAIFVEHAANQAIVYIVKGGSIAEVHSSEVEDDFVGTIEKLLANVNTVTNLPAKIVLHDYEGVESLQQEFLNHEWKKELNFLQIPQVLVLDKGFENEAVIHGVASQMGFDVLQNLQAGAHVIDDESQDSAQSEEDIEIAAPEEFGFSQGEVPSAPIADEPPEEEATPEEPEEDVQESVESSQPLSQDHQNIQEPKIHDPNENKKDIDEKKEDTIEEPENDKQDEKVDTRTTLVDTLKSMAPFSFISKLKGKGGTSSLLKQGLNLRVGLIAFAAVAILALGTYLYYMYFLKVEVVIFADSTVVEQEEEVVFS